MPVAGHRTDHRVARGAGRIPISGHQRLIDWRIEANYKKLEKHLLEGKTATEIMPFFPGSTRSGIIGAAKRLKENGRITAGFKGSGQFGPRPGKRKDPAMSQREKAARNHDRNEGKRIAQAAKDHENTIHKHRHNVFSQDPITREFVEVEAQAWTTHKELAAFNKTRKPYAKRLLECTGCKFPIDDQLPYMFCNATKSDGVYCSTHAAWCRGAVPARKTDPKPFHLSKSKYTS
jgi:hypothetical protein